MQDVLGPLLGALEDGRSAALAVVVHTWSSSPRPVGAAMLVTADGAATGSVSGGCVEGALYEIAQEVIETGRSVLETFGVSDDDALAVGLPCGGSIDVFVGPVTLADWPELPGLVASVEAAEPAAVAVVVETSGASARHMVLRENGSTGSLGSRRLDDAVRDDARGLLAAGNNGVLQYGLDGERLGTGLEVVVIAFAPPPRMFVFGAVDFAAALCRAGRLLGFHVTVVDARSVFATAARFPDADEVVVDWPHRWLATQDVDERTVICVLTHDRKFDVPALVQAVQTPAGYIGAMGSRRTHEQRTVALREAGLTDADVDRIHSPIGLDLGARTPEETAVSIAAEIVLTRWGGSGTPLTGVTGPIHTSPSG